MYDHYDYLEAALSRTEARLDYVEGGLVRESEAQAADAERRDRHAARVREVASPAFARALGGEFFGRTVPVRETMHPLGGHHEPGPAAARESNPNPWIEGVERMFDGVPSRPVRYEDMLALEQSRQQARAARPVKQATDADKRICAGFENGIAHGGLRQ